MERFELGKGLGRDFFFLSWTRQNSECSYAIPPSHRDSGEQGPLKISCTKHDTSNFDDPISMQEVCHM